jgi:hypothetical protein
MTKATFTDIRKQLIKQIRLSNNKVIVAVAWFTSMDLLGELTDKLKSGCHVEIIISDHKENGRLSFGAFLRGGGKVYILKSGSGKFLHEKFAVFDSKTIIAGSYNWTNSAEFYNHESVIESNEITLIKQFSIRFENLKRIVVDYNRDSLVISNEVTAENKESEFIELENQLADDFLITVKMANSLGGNINERIIENYIASYGAIGAANRLINAGTEMLHSGLIKLFEINRLDLSFEAIIQKEKYRKLFNQETLDRAIERIKIFSKK